MSEPKPKLTLRQTWSRYTGKIAVIIIATGAADWLPGLYAGVTTNESVRSAIGERWYGIVVTALGVVCFVARMLPQSLPPQDRRE